MEDRDRSLSIQDVSKFDELTGFLPAAGAVPSFGASKSAYWFRLKVANPHNEAKKWWLEIQDPLLDNIDVYYQRGNEIIKHIQLGDHYPLVERTVKVRNPIAVLRLNAKEEIDVIIRIQTYGSMSAPIFLWLPEAYPAQALNLQMGYGIYFGLIAALFLYNLLLFFSIKDISYLYYCFFIAWFSVWQFAYNGLGYEYIWSNSGEINIIVAVVASNFYAVFSLLFTRSFLYIPKLFPKLNRLMIGCIAFAFVPLLIFFVFSQSVGVKINSLFLLSTMLIIFSVSIFALFKGVVEARYFFVAWLTLIFGVSVFCMVLFGWIPATFITIHGQQIGSAVEAVLLSFALAHRMRLLMVENERIQIEAKQSLERRVLERTNELDVAMHDLEKANALLKEKSFNDGLTGVRNRFFLDEQYQKEWLRSRRDGSTLSLLMIDIDHFKLVNDKYGHLCGDRVLCFVAKIIADIVSRPGDVVARYGGEEFLVVLPDTGEEGAYTIAESIRSKLEETVFKFNDLAIGITVSIGFVAQVVSRDEQDSNNLISTVDKALYHAKNNGRNRVVLAAA